MTEFSWPSRTTADAMARAGWTAGRVFDTRPWFAELEAEGYLVSAYADEILSSCGGLTIAPIQVAGALYAGRRIEFDPLSAGDGMRERYAEIEIRLGQRVCPLADCGGESALLVLENDVVVEDWSGGVRMLGESLPEALDLVIRRHRWPETMLDFRG
ncbi:SUKH-3 domain-containing protein [Nocardia cyriacigeorgica]|uniref:SUKH-3 domain-containing protein n=1 Tax=Nocardia cyriacigeorgica TaxID=135487 RepID=UPI001894BE20|nr:SUKH-3 domain-containing protein [Nocardia cyriacigeorgica]MBF6426163.1 SUKH-3 domain-containing protein [Nocardia cyriacigeorgica]